MWWIVLAAVFVVVAITAFWVDRRRHPRDVSEQARREQGRRDGRPGGYFNTGGGG
jgi:hypothetical protein